jgi:hypothetical protein
MFIVRSECVKALLCGVLTLLVAIPAAAQVGHEPASSPYTDLEHSQELTLFGGYVKARHDPAGVAPQSAPTVGMRYEITVAGPLALSSDLAAFFSQRDVIDPTKPLAQRLRRSEDAAVYSADVALAMNLTGRKSWHHLVPQVRGGIGLLHSAAKDDSSGFHFGTPFAFVLGGGLKLVPGRSGRVQLRADFTDRIFKLSYPDSYYRLASDNTAVLDRSTAKSFYTHHAAFTLGVSYLFGR